MLAPCVHARHAVYTPLQALQRTAALFFEGTERVPVDGCEGTERVSVDGCCLRTSAARPNSIRASVVLSSGRANAATHAHLARMTEMHADWAGLTEMQSCCPLTTYTLTYLLPP